jgi:hypothetical protein
MMMIDGGKDKFTNLLTLIKYESPKLYNAISDLCLDGTFRSQKYQNTFLMPNEKLINHIVSLVDKDDDIKAIDIVRSLLLKGHHDVKSFAKGAKIGTVQFGSFILANPEEVGKAVSHSKKQVIVTRDNKFATVVLHYAADSAPKTEEGKADGKSGGVVLVSSAISGGVSNEYAAKVRDIALKLIDNSCYKKTMKNFFKAVSCALNILEKDAAEFNKAKCYMSANPVLSWFFLTMPGRSDSLIKDEHLDLIASNWESTTDFSVIDRVKTAGGYKFCPNAMNSLKALRSKITSNSDITRIYDGIHNAYKSGFDILKNAGAVCGSDSVALKLRMDELRFLYDGATDCNSKVQDMITELGRVENYVSPESASIMIDKNLYSSMVKPVEAIKSGPVAFVDSVYFLYMPLTPEVESKLDALMQKSLSGGSISGGDPSSSRVLAYYGGAARASMKKHSKPVQLTSLVKMLSADQRKALKEML